MSFVSLGAIPAGLRWLEAAGVERMGRHAGELARGLALALGALRHQNGSPMVLLYGPREWMKRGATVTFNVLDDRGGIVSHEEVEARARDARVSVRGGCFCNPGAAEAAGIGFGSLTAGAVRASLGVSSNARDVMRLVEVVEEVAGRHAGKFTVPISRAVILT